jgi:hypothetical protein
MGKRRRLDLFDTIFYGTGRENFPARIEIIKDLRDQLNIQGSRMRYVGI